VIGRGVEDGLLRTVETLAEKASCRQLFAEFVPTPRNLPARGFYERSGFTPVSHRASGETRYVKELR
jgi:predicted enzyme involved in methoxymalonyl-ACP biosynthesis